jgi:hypothetical protein
MEKRKQKFLRLFIIWNIRSALGLKPICFFIINHDLKVVAILKLPGFLIAPTFRSGKKNR